MYNAKSQGRHRYQFYQMGLIEKSTQLLGLENDLYKALENNELYLTYQVQVTYIENKKRISGFEALLRWKHPSQGIILPDIFIPLAENLGLINKMGAWTLREACEQHKEWLKDKRIDDSIKIAVNISSYQLMNAHCIETLNILEETKINPDCLEIEMTESVLINQNNQIILKALENVRALGIKVTIDDFGTGDSSLAYLTSLPITKLKIDKSFVHNIDTTRSSNAIVDSMINLAKSINIDVIAEGVEMIEQERYLIQKGCKEAQCYLYSKPLTTEEVDKLLKSLPNDWIIGLKS